MAIMKSYCCFSNMKTACKITSIYIMIISFVYIVLEIVSCMKKEDKIEEHHWKSFKHIVLPMKNAERTWTIICIIMYALGVCAGILLYLGSRKGYMGRSKIKFSIGIVSVCILFHTMVFIADLAVLSSPEHNPEISSKRILIAFGIWISQMFCLIDGLLPAIALYQLLGEEGPNGPLSQSHTPRTVPTATFQAGSIYLEETSHSSPFTSSNQIASSPETQSPPPPYVQNEADKPEMVTHMTLF